MNTFPRKLNGKNKVKKSFDASTPGGKKLVDNNYFCWGSHKSGGRASKLLLSSVPRYYKSAYILLSVFHKKENTDKDIIVIQRIFFIMWNDQRFYEYIISVQKKKVIRVKR